MHSYEFLKGSAPFCTIYVYTDSKIDLELDILPIHIELIKKIKHDLE